MAMQAHSASNVFSSSSASVDTCESKESSQSLPLPKPTAAAAAAKAPGGSGNSKLARRSLSHNDTAEQLQPAVPLKDRLYTALNRFRYGWNFRSSVEIFPDVPIWLLGECYHITKEEAKVVSKRDIEGAPPHILRFLEDFNSLVWMTYRTNFPPIEGTSITTDCGWGCMVRSGQMILATALNRFLLTRQWRLSTSSKADKIIHRQVLSWFADFPSPLCPFSLHAMMQVAVGLGNRPGDWFGPSQLAILIRECVKNSRGEHPLLEDLLVYVAHDCTVYIGDILDIYEEKPHSSSLLLLVPVRLGSESLNPIYIPCVKSLLALDHCVGIIGGKPKHSVYFVGFQDNKLVHLDPHYCQMATEPSRDKNYRDFDIKTYHCRTPRKLAASRMDPSCTIGFLCTSLAQFYELKSKAEKLLAPPLQKGVYPFFSFSDLHLEEVMDIPVNMHLADSHLFLDKPSTFPPLSSSSPPSSSSISSISSSSSFSRSSWRQRRSKDSLEGLRFCDDEDFVVVDCIKSESSSLVVSSATGSEGDRASCSAGSVGSEEGVAVVAGRGHGGVGGVGGVGSDRGCFAGDDDCSCCSSGNGRSWGSCCQNAGSSLLSDDSNKGCGHVNGSAADSESWASVQNQFAGGGGGGRRNDRVTTSADTESWASLQNQFAGVGGSSGGGANGGGRHGRVTTSADTESWASIPEAGGGGSGGKMRRSQVGSSAGTESWASIQNRFAAGGSSEGPLATGGGGSERLLVADEVAVEEASGEERVSESTLEGGENEFSTEEGVGEVVVDRVAVAFGGEEEVFSNQNTTR